MVGAFFVYSNCSSGIGENCDGRCILSLFTVTVARV